MNASNQTYTQPSLLAAMHAREVGVELVLERQSEYRSKVEAAIQSLAADWQEFTSDDVRLLVGECPKGVSTNLVGALFIAASRAGIIRPVGFGYSARIIGHKNVVRRWVGVR